MKLLLISVTLVLSTSLAFAAGSKEIPTKTSAKDSGVVAYNEGVKLMRQKNFSGAKLKFEKALNINSHLAEAHNNLAYCLRRMGPNNFKSSLEHYNEAIELKPQMAEAYMYRGILYWQMKDLEHAKADLKKLQALRSPLAKELQEVFEKGKEEDDEFYGLASEL
ncbi:MAG: hypothetical protein JWQ35_1233 [Bacteriovoracaceae bacterium]|nr:hypothetical protein [Bacteriovoracaceae bacterium]